MVEQQSGHWLRRLSGAFVRGDRAAAHPSTPEPHTALTPDRSFAPVSAPRRGSALAPPGCMRPTSGGLIGHGSDEDAAIVALAVAAAAEQPSIPPVNLEQMDISELAVRLVPERLAWRHLVVPIRLDNRTLTYGTFQPFDGEAERDLSSAAGRQAISVPATRTSVLASLQRFYPKLQDLERITGRPGAEGATAMVETRARRVLITDDEPITRMLVKLLLEKETYEVLEARTGRQAVDIAKRERPDLLIIDLHMPEMDGYQAIAHIRAELTLATMPIVVLTSEDGPGVERRVLDLGADDYVIKPFDAEVLLSRVNAVFRRLPAVAA